MSTAEKRKGGKGKERKEFGEGKKGERRLSTPPPDPLRDGTKKRVKYFS